MNNYKIYSVSDRYIDYLRKYVPGVYSNKEETRTHTRKYIGVVYSINGYNYYIPLSSPKDTDYKLVKGKKVIRKSVVPIMRITDKNSAEEPELKATLRISHMIPVPLSELTLYDLDNEPDLEYKDLVQKEIIFIRKNKEKIKGNAKLIYKQKAINDQTANYVKMALDYKLLEELCEIFLKTY